ncbi:hypothetical protein PCIT_a1495 [Pseudoalteromonas citrea]|uniref:Uncharacterized protein n=1 Tax=Pseudoalteromonas citrea TaxID=43655 RepID=A0AAD4AMD1_9GAMM|nr:hypothetical protein PCIT_a1495 [Pseudoalteromonas citrea]
MKFKPLIYMIFIFLLKHKINSTYISTDRHTNPSKKAWSIPISLKEIHRGHQKHQKTK